ncbi:MAG: NAD(P)H-dependent oxidoreductase subunit E [Phycisphaerae bacterium]|nr:NAD(P)H-dependent oxidoreductase subunit E [Phycisphaerae bacterium]
MSVDLQPVGQLCKQHVASRGSLVMLLQETQQRYGYLPREVLKAISREIGVPLARLYGLATFYRSFSLTPRGKHEVCVCTGTACHVRGAATMLEHLQRRLAVTSGGTTADGEFTLVTVNCLGACALGPVLVLDGKYHGKVTVAKADEVLAAVGNRPTEANP